MSKTYVEHPFAQYVRILGKGKKGSRSLTEQEAYEAMTMILNNETDPLQLGAFLMLMRVKEESPEELAGFVKAAKAQIHAPSELSVDLDWSSYAGKRRHLPWYLLAVLALADSGIRIFMHGASGHTAERIYTEEVLSDLGFPAASSWSEVAQQLDNQNFSYLPLKTFLPMMDEMINMRAILGLRSPVHSLSRLLNPLNAPCVLQGIFHPPYNQMHQKAGQLLGYNHLCVIKGEGGEIERNPDTDLTAYIATSDSLSEEVWPSVFERRHVKPSTLSLDTLKGVWAGTHEDEYGEGAIIATMALALKSMGKATTQTSALSLAEEIWNNRNKTRL